MVTLLYRRLKAHLGYLLVPGWHRILLLGLPTHFSTYCNPLCSVRKNRKAFPRALTKKFEASQKYIDQVFAHLYADLGMRVDALSQPNQDYRLYNQLNIARIIRQLIVDGTSVSQLANKPRRLPLVALVKEYGSDPGVDEKTIEHYPDWPVEGSLPPGMYYKPVKIRRWLEASVMNLGGEELKRRVVIKYVANQYGGVHLEPELDDEVHKTMARFQTSLRVGRDDPVLAAVNDIARGVIWSLRPLWKRVNSDYQSK